MADDNHIAVLHQIADGFDRHVLETIHHGGLGGNGIADIADLRLQLRTKSRLGSNTARRSPSASSAAKTSRVGFHADRRCQI